jgi:nicotinamidase-related amidase
MPDVKAEPYAFTFDLKTTALLMIDFQRDFVDPGGFGEALGNDVSLLRRAVPPAARVLSAARQRGLLVVHTREGHRPDLTDCPPSKKARGRLKAGIGDDGPMGRILVRGEAGHDIVKELYPEAGEPVIDKPGKGAFYATDLDAILRHRGIRQLIVCGVTTEVCVNTTVREANDRGYDCLVLEDCVASYFPAFHKTALEMVKAQGGIFGWVADSQRVLKALAGSAPSPARRGRLRRDRPSP